MVTASSTATRADAPRLRAASPVGVSPPDTVPPLRRVHEAHKGSPAMNEPNAPSDDPAVIVDADSCVPHLGSDIVPASVARGRMLALRAAPMLVERLDALAAAMGITRSDAHRAALERGLGVLEAPPDAVSPDGNAPDARPASTTTAGAPSGGFATW